MGDVSLPSLRQLLLLVGGCVVLGVGVALLLTANLGSDGFSTLVNGVTITRERDVPEIFTYHHIELATHDLILAEGAPAETFVDNVERVVFDNRDEHETLYGHLEPIPEMDLPRAISARQVPAATRRRLAAIAAARAGGARVA